MSRKLITTSTKLSLRRQYNFRILNLIKSRWLGMHHRVEHDPKYRNVTICYEWNKSNPNGIENFYQWSLQNGFAEDPNLVLDKDYKMWEKGKKSYEYSPYTCSYIGRLKNGLIGGFVFYEHLACLYHEG